MHNRQSTGPLHGRLLAALAALFISWPACAGHGSPETLGGVATVLAIFVICVVPIVGIVVFWMVHVLPEKIAHKRNHPQTQAIQVLCLLSLVFGGLLWPIAWLWAYTKPVLYKMAYGTDQMEERHATGAAHEAEPAGSLREGIARVRADLERLSSQGGAPRELAAIRDQLAALEPRAAAQAEEAR